MTENDTKQDDILIGVIGQEAYDRILENWGGRQTKPFTVDGCLVGDITLQTDADTWKFFATMEGLTEQVKNVTLPVFLLFIALYDEKSRKLRIETMQCDNHRFVETTEVDP